MRRIHAMMIAYVGNGQRLMAIALLWFVALFAPVACIVHCHLWFSTSAQPGSDLFVCDLLHGSASDHQHDGHVPGSPALPRILYDALLLLTLAVPILVLLARFEPPTLNWRLLLASPPPSPPPRASAGRAIGAC
ncbi:MAG: hypothetical protein Fur005_40900 [Roseiflexaceae bacterium]